MCLHRKTKQTLNNSAQSPAQLNITPSTLCGEIGSFQFFSPFPKHHVGSGKTYPFLPHCSHQTYCSTPYARSKDPARTPRIRVPGVQQNLASSVVVKALCLQNKRVRKGFSTECKDWCHVGEGYAKARHKWLCESMRRLLIDTATAATGYACSYLEEILTNFQGPQR